MTLPSPPVARVPCDQTILRASPENPGSVAMFMLLLTPFFAPFQHHTPERSGPPNIAHHLHPRKPDPCFLALSLTPALARSSHSSDPRHLRLCSPVSRPVHCPGATVVD